MSTLPNALRARAKEVLAQLDGLLAEQILPDDSDGMKAKRLVAAIKAAVVPEVFSAMADVLEATQLRGPITEAEKLAQRMIERNRQFNAAAAAGRWDEFDRLIRDYVGENGSDTGGNGAASNGTQREPETPDANDGD